MPLYLAAGQNKNSAVIEVLLSAGANVNMKVELSLTPLHVATAYNEDPAVTETLLSAGADINAKAGSG